MSSGHHPRRPARPSPRPCRTAIGTSAPRPRNKSAGKLGVDQIDLLILHQALRTAFDKTLAKAASVVVAVESGAGPYLLMLGNDASAAVPVALDAPEEDVDTWEKASRSTDFDR